MTGPARTDWDNYYQKPYKTASYSRGITARELAAMIARNAAPGLSVAEFGGANSCFYDGLVRRFSPARYAVLDNNELGLRKFTARADAGKAEAQLADVLNFTGKPEFDLVFSMGLIEHFPPEQTLKAVEAHFRAAKPGGLVIISFPTPTLLYRLTRGAAEALGLWIFHDERPLWLSEILPEINKYGEVLESRVIWPIFLTQTLVAARKRPG